MDTKDTASPVRAAILEAATALFRAEGFRATSADRVLAAAGYSKVTFYRHFATKDDLVVAYLEAELARVKTLAAGPSATTPADSIYAEMCAPGFRGCPFLNAAAEYPDPTHPARRVVARFRAWMTSTVSEWLASVGVEEPEPWSHAILMVRDGALAAGYLDEDPQAAVRNLTAAIEAIVARAQHP